MTTTRTRRGNGFGSLINKGEGKPWLGRWVYQGQVYYKSTGEVDKKKALKVLERITRPYRDAREEDVIRNLQNRLIQLQECKTKSKLQLDDIWSEFAKKLKNDDVEAGTAKNYENAVNQLAAWMKSKVRFARDITTSLAEAYLDDLYKTVGANTYNQRLVLFKRIWKALAEEFQLCNDVWERFKKKKPVKSTRRTLSNNELAKILNTAGTPDLKLLLEIGIYTGLRISDCSLLKWSEVDFENKVLKVRPIKTRKHMDGPIEIPIHPTLLKALEDTPHTGEYVSEANACGYKSGRVGEQVIELFKKCGIETSKKVDGKTKLLCGFHSLRHTFVSMAVNAGLSPLLVQRIVGHSSIDMTTAYFHDNMNTMREGIEKLPAIA